MLKSFLFTLFFLFSFQLSNIQVFAKCSLDYVPFHKLKGSRSLDDLNEVKIASYNVLNLDYSPGKYINDPVTGNRIFQKQRLTKNPKQIQGIVKAIKSEKLDIIVMQEVEGKASLDLFNKQHLGDEYEAFIIKGNDTKGIDVGFLIKKDLPFKIKFTTHKNRTYTNSFTEKNENVFTRDLPAMHIWTNNKSALDPPSMVILGNHLKSQRDRFHDAGSKIYRTRQVQEVKKIVREYEGAYPDLPVFIAGDFNANIHVGEEFKTLFKDDFLMDSFDYAKKRLSNRERVTHTYHPRNGPTSYNQLDAILVNKNASELVLDAKVYRYKNKLGEKRPLPSSYAERELNPSDHFPVVLKLDLSHLNR